jgi:hypothetical protein
VTQKGSRDNALLFSDLSAIYGCLDNVTALPSSPWEIIPVPVVNPVIFIVITKLKIPPNTTTFY